MGGFLGWPISSLRSPWLPFLQRVKNTCLPGGKSLLLTCTGSAFPPCWCIEVLSLCTCLHDSTSYDYNHLFIKLPLSLNFSLNESRAPTLFGLDLLFLTLWFAHSRLFMNTCQGKERDIAHGGPVTITGMKQI